MRLTDEQLRQQFTETFGKLAKSPEDFEEGCAAYIGMMRATQDFFDPNMSSEEFRAKYPRRDEQ